MSLKKSASSSPSLFNFNNELTSDPLKIANVFNNYFSSIGEKTQPKIRFSNKNYTDYLHDENLHSFFITSTYSEEVIPIISLLSDSKYSRPNSISTGKLKLPKKYISTHLIDILISLFLQEYTLLPSSLLKLFPQFGFTQNYSTSFALIHLT